ncbi:MAG: S1/P1 nuclease [Porticoccaceae bacterium]
MNKALPQLGTYLLTGLLLFSGEAFSFGAKGHRIVATIAQNHLTEITRQAIAELNNGPQLEHLATWPDRIKSDPNWDHAKRWHYISINDDERFKTLQRDPKGDILYALARFEAELSDNALSQSQRRQALAFLVHFVADVHQPLHVGRRDDRGGNSIKVNWRGKTFNLHQVWDSGLIADEKLSESAYVALIDRSSRAQQSVWQDSQYIDWANESKRLRDQIYDFSPNRADGRSGRPILGESYVLRSKVIVKQRLLKAGVRLAGRLNHIFDPQ